MIVIMIITLIMIIIMIMIMIMGMIIAGPMRIAGFHGSSIKVHSRDIQRSYIFLGMDPHISSGWWLTKPL